MQRIIYYVLHRKDEWQVVRARDEATEGRFQSKSDAVELAQFLAMREEVAELRICHMDGSIQSECVFGKDPLLVEG